MWLKPFLAAAVAALLSMASAQQPRPRFPWPEGKRGAVSLTFDDARLSQVDTGLPLLDKYGVKATFYVTPASVEKRLAGWKRAVAAKHEIGNHSNTHPCTGNFAFSFGNALENYTLATLEKDLDTADREIGRLLGVKPATFAFPCGQKFIGRGTSAASYVPLIARRYLAGRGFRDEAANDPAFCDFAQLLGVESDGLDFEPLRKLVASATSEGRWLVFAGHEIGAPRSQTTRSAALEQLLQYAKDPANGIWIDTAENVARWIQSHRPR